MLLKPPRLGSRAPRLRWWRCRDIGVVAQRAAAGDMVGPLAGACPPSEFMTASRVRLPNTGLVSHGNSRKVYRCCAHINDSRPRSQPAR